MERCDEDLRHVLDSAPCPTPEELCLSNQAERNDTQSRVMIFTDLFSTPTPVCLSARNPFVSSHNSLLSDTLRRNESIFLNADGEGFSKQDSQTATVETRGETIQLPFEGETPGANV